MIPAMKTRIRIALGEKQELALGGLEFEVLRREVGEDSGTSIEIFGEVAGQRTQVLRFDCFQKDPHYHMPPAAPGQLAIDPARVGDPLEWALACTRERLPEMVRAAGYADLADKLDGAALRAGADRVRELVANAPPPDPAKAFEIEMEMPPVNPC
jgi:hypothetical protein